MSAERRPSAAFVAVADGDAGPEVRHPLLERQVRRLVRAGVIGPADAASPAWQALLGRISKAYDDFDRERYLLERSQQIAGREMAMLHAQLRASEARLASLVSLSSDWIWETDRRGRLTHLTAPRERHDIDLRRCMGKPLLPMVTAALDDRTGAAFRRHLRDAEPFRDVVVGLLPSADRRLYLRVSGEPMHVDGRLRGYRGVASDVTGAVLDRQAVERLANLDPLTGLPNRARFQELLADRIATTPDGGGFALLFVDLDRFKAINDTLGHDAGDRLLRIVAGRLAHAVRGRDVVARLGGDEFVVLVADGADMAALPAMADRVLEQLRRPVAFGPRTVHPSASIGLARYPDDGRDADALLRNADAAMYQSKEAGKGTWRAFTAELAARQREGYALEEELRHALERHEFRLVFQPLFDTATRRCTGAEALLRWQHPTRGLLTPAAFLETAESSGLLVPIGRWVLHEACRQMTVWAAAGVDVPVCAVNLSLKQLAAPTLVDDVRSALAEAGLEGARLEVEITESQMMADPARVQETIEQLRHLGVRVAIDDFGTGYSSLAYLKRLAAATLKVDRSFVRGLPADPDDAAIMRAVLALGHSVGMQVVAEGVETEAQLAFLQEIGCDRVQGYLLGRPDGPEAMAQRLPATSAV